MVKQKIHTARNQTFKAHRKCVTRSLLFFFLFSVFGAADALFSPPVVVRSGIKRPVKHRYRSTKGMDPKFLRNARYALRGTKAAVKKQRKAGDDIDQLLATSTTPYITLRSGREIPKEIIGGAMLSLTNRNVMRLLLHNQATLAALFEEYAVDGEMSPEEGMKFAMDFDIVPEMCNKAQFTELWVLVNNSEAADDDATQCDSEEFVELMVRLAVFYAPGPNKLADDQTFADLFRTMLRFMNASKGGLKRGTNFKTDKVKGK